jgi:hypothetical protein
MTVQTVKLCRREFVIVPKKDFVRLQRRAGELSSQDRADVPEALCRLRDPKEKRIPWSQVKKSAGLE